MMQPYRVNIALDDIIEYQTFRRNPGPLITRVREGRPMLLIKGSKRVIVLDACEYEQLVQRAERAERSSIHELRTGTEG